MVKKKSIRKKSVEKKGIKKSVTKSKPAKLITSDINADIKEVKREVKQAERWMIARRRFFIKLAIIVGMIAILLILSNFYLKSSGFG